MRTKLGRRRPRRQVQSSVRQEFCGERHFGLGDGQQGAGFFQFLFLGRADESIGADFDKPFGQDMTQKAADEFLGWQGGVFEFLGFVVAISEGDLPVLKLLQSAVFVKGSGLTNGMFLPRPAELSGNTGGRWK